MVAYVGYLKMALKRAYWKLCAMRTDARAADRHVVPWRYSIAKKNEDTWPFDDIIKMGQQGGFDQVYPYEHQITVIREALADSLRGKMRQTSFRHEVVEMDAAECFAGVSSANAGGRLLHALVCMCNPQLAVELGSAFGMSSMYVVDAIREVGYGEFVGIELEAWRAEIAQRNIESVTPECGKVVAGPIERVLPEAVPENGGEKIDFAFVDAVHKYENTMEYHQLLKKRIGEGAIVVYDDINWSEEMRRFWGDLMMDSSVTDALLVDQRYGCVRYHAAAR